MIDNIPSEQTKSLCINMDLLRTCIPYMWCTPYTRGVLYIHVVYSHTEQIGNIGRTRTSLVGNEDRGQLMEEKKIVQVTPKTVRDYRLPHPYI